jgi:hypothetical protein
MMNSPSSGAASAGVGVAAPDLKSPVQSTPKLVISGQLRALTDVMVDALPDIPKPVVQLTAAYLRRPPPFELIRELSRDISPDLCSNTAHIPGSAWSDRLMVTLRATNGTSDVTVTPFYGGDQLRKIFSSQLLQWPDYVRFRVCPMQMLSGLLDPRRCEAEHVARAIASVRAADPGALCLLELTWGFALVAVPEAYCADAAAGPDAWPLLAAGRMAELTTFIEPLLVEKQPTGPLCGLMIFKAG